MISSLCCVLEMHAECSACWVVLCKGCWDTNNHHSVGNRKTRALENYCPNTQQVVEQANILGTLQVGLVPQSFSIDELWDNRKNVNHYEHIRRLRREDEL